MKLDFWSIVGIVIMGLALILLVGYYFTQGTNECSASPLTFGAKMYGDSFGGEAWGNMYITTDNRIIEIKFNSTNALLKVQK